MADKTIKTTIQLNDQISKPINRMISAMDSLIGAFDTVDDSMDRAFNVDAIVEAKNEIGRAAAELDEFARKAEESGKQSEEEFGRFGKIIDEVTGKFGKLMAMMTAGATVKFLFDFGIASMRSADIQNNAETQLQTVLMNQGAQLIDYKAIQKRARDLQAAGMYGDEALLGGAAELATYISDTAAIEKMMGTLSNFAAGMSGGGAVDYEQMVNYATQLGKALDGTYDGLKKKGFELSDAQKEIIENGTDMEKALVLDEVIGQSWDNLYNTMSNTPQGKLVSLNNLISDLREEVGNRLYPVFARVADTIVRHIDSIERAFNSMVVIIGVVGKAFDILLNITLPIFNAIYDAIGTVAKFFVDAFAGAIDGVQVLFYGFASMALEAISWVAEGLSKLPFVEFDYEGLSAKAKEYADKSWDVYNNGSSAGNAVRDFFNFDAWDSTLDWDSQNLARNVSDIADATGETADAVKITQEELKYLNDIAEREAINRFTTAEIKVEMTNNNAINNKLDLDGIVSDLTEMVYVAMSGAAEGVYA